MEFSYPKKIPNTSWSKHVQITDFLPYSYFLGFAACSGRHFPLLQQLKNMVDFIASE